MKPILCDDISVLEQNTQLNRFTDVKNNMHLYRPYSRYHYLKDSKSKALWFQLIGNSVPFKRFICWVGIFVVGLVLVLIQTF